MLVIHDIKHTRTFTNTRARTHAYSHIRTHAHTYTFVRESLHKTIHIQIAVIHAISHTRTLTITPIHAIIHFRKSQPLQKEKHGNVKRDHEGNEIETCVKDGVRYEVYETQKMVYVDTVCNDCGKELAWSLNSMPTIQFAGTFSVHPNHVPAWKKRRRRVP